MPLAATRKMIEVTTAAENDFWLISDSTQEAVQPSDKCDLCGEPLTQGERYTHKTCSDYENFLASL